MDYSHFFLSLCGFWLWLLAGLLERAKGYPLRPTKSTRNKLLIFIFIPLLIGFLLPRLSETVPALPFAILGIAVIVIAYLLRKKTSHEKERHEGTEELKSPIGRDYYSDKLLRLKAKGLVVLSMASLGASFFVSASATPLPLPFGLRLALLIVPPLMIPWCFSRLRL